MTQLARHHADLSTMMALMSDEIRKEVDDVGGEARDLPISVKTDLKEADDSLAAPLQRRDQLLAAYPVAIDALRNRKIELPAEHLDPHAAGVVDMARDHSHGATRSARDLLRPELVREVLEQEDRDAMVGSPRIQQSFSQHVAFAFQLHHLDSLAFGGDVGSVEVEEQAGDRSRTGDLQLGKLTLYQLSYARNERKNGAGGIRTPDFCDVNAAL